MAKKTSDGGGRSGNGGKSRGRNVLVVVALGALEIAKNKELRERIVVFTDATSKRTVSSLRAKRDVNHYLECWRKEDEGSRESLIRAGSKTVRPLTRAWDSLDDREKRDAATILGAIGDKRALKLLKMDSDETSPEVRTAMKKAREEILRANRG